jgi:membrane protein DedA with SNARE-associated domain
MVRNGSKPVRLGVIEEAWACSTCGREFTTFNRLGHWVWWTLTVGLGVLFVTGFTAGKVKHGDEVPVAALGLVLIGTLAVLGGRALWHARANPPA